MGFFYPPAGTCTYLDKIYPPGQEYALLAPIATQSASPSVY